MDHNTKKQAFTLVELLVVMGIIGILIGLLFPAIGAARKAAHKAQAGVEVRSIATAIEAYYNEYGKLPLPDGVQGKDDSPEEGVERGAYWSVKMASGSIDIIKILTASPTAPSSDYGSPMNPRQIIFLEAQNSGSAADIKNGVFVDPWGEQYMMALDSDYNGKMGFYSGGAGDEIITKSVIVYSYGSDPASIPDEWLVMPDPAFPDFISSSFD